MRVQRWFLNGLFIVALTLSLQSVVAAQTPDDGDGTRLPIYAEPVYITVPSEEPLVLWVRSVDRDEALAVVLVQTPDGWTQMTPCDNAEIVCKDVALTAEGTQAGDVFFLGSE